MLNRTLCVSPLNCVPQVRARQSPAAAQTADDVLSDLPDQSHSGHQSARLLESGHFFNDITVRRGHCDIQLPSASQRFPQSLHDGVKCPMLPGKSVEPGGLQKDDVKEVAFALLPDVRHRHLAMVVRLGTIPVDRAHDNALTQVDLVFCIRQSVGLRPPRRQSKGRRWGKREVQCLCPERPGISTDRGMPRRAV